METSLEFRDRESRLTEEEKARRRMSDDALRALRADLTWALDRDGVSDPYRTADARGEVVRDIDEILHRRENGRRSVALTRDSTWGRTWRGTVQRLARELVDAREAHSANARGALREVACGERRPEGAPNVRDTSRAMEDLYQVLEGVCRVIPDDIEDEVVRALRRVFADREEPFYSYRVTDDGFPVDPEEKRRCEERMARYCAVWKDLGRIVRGDA